LRLAGTRTISRLLDFLAARLSRVTSSGELIPEIDGLRFLAISTVILHHAMSILLPASGRTGPIHTPSEWFDSAERFSPLVGLAYCGHFGVNLFFAISGFILAMPFARKLLNGLPAPGWKSYYLRRLTRIEPPYVICLLIFFGYLAIEKGRGAELLPNLLASLIYSHGLIFGQHSQVNAVTWSLEIEIQFYVLVPLLVSVFRLRNRIVRRLLLLAAVALGGWLSQHVVYPSGSARLALSLANFFAYFLAGFLLADLYLGGWLRAEKRLAFDLLALLAAAAIVLVLTTHGHFYFSLPLLILPLYIGCFRGRASNAFLRARWIAITGGMCYTLYLYHAPILSEFSWNINSLFSVARPIGLDYLTQLLIVCPAIFALCSLWFVLTEKPFMKWSLSATPDRIRATTFVAPSSQND
jgi:peptidoglycan/LPS O-acetylase OafA/YrhL